MMQKRTLSSIFCILDWGYVAMNKMCEMTRSTELMNGQCVEAQLSSALRCSMAAIPGGT